jgi:GT2 family glycosyltransferase
MSKEVLVSVVITNWNGKRYLAECLNSLKNQTYHFLEIIVVDNGSSDDSIEFIKTNFPEVRIIANKTNVGFAEANNTGIMAAKGKYIATLNNDTVAEPGWLLNLIEAAERRREAAMFASKILSLHNPNLIESKGMLIYPDGIAKCRGFLTKDNAECEKEEEVLLPSACAALYRKDILFLAGLFDKDYFAYCEDVDIGLRIRMLGFSCLYVPRARTYHYYSGTSRQNLLLKVYLAERNRLWTIIKTFPIPDLMVSLIFTFKRYIFYLYGAWLKITPIEEFCAKESKLIILFILAKAYLSTLLNLIKLLKKRQYIMDNKKVPAKEIRAWLKKYKIGIREMIFT